MLVLRMIVFGAMGFLQVSKQWGTNSSNSINTRVAYNIPFTTFEIPVSIANDDGTQIYRYSIGKHDINGFNQIVASDVLINTFNRVWFSIGKQ